MKNAKKKVFSTRILDSTSVSTMKMGRRKAERSVEIAEQEIFEKAVKLFYEDCEMYAGDGKYLEGGKCENCDRVNKFKQKLMER